MGVIQEFKKFAIKGNVVDLAVAVIIGGAFGTIVTSFVNDIIMPPIGILLGGVDFTDLKWVLRDAYLDPEGVDLSAVTVNYGTFVQNIVNFLIISFTIFMAIQGINRLKGKEEAIPTPPPAPTNEEILLAEIRDLLKNQQANRNI